MHMAKIVNNALCSTNAQITVATMLDRYVAVAPRRTGDHMASSWAWKPERKPDDARPRTLPTEYFHAKGDGSPSSS